MDFLLMKNKIPQWKKFWKRIASKKARKSKCIKNGNYYKKVFNVKWVFYYYW